MLFIFFLLVLSLCYYKNEKIAVKTLPQFLSSQKYIIQSLKDHQILQKYYLFEFSPIGELLVEFSSKETKKMYPVTFGNYISPMDALDPSITFKSFFPYDVNFIESYYTIAVTDLNPKFETCYAIWSNLGIDKRNIRFSESSNKSHDNKKLGSDKIPFMIHFDLEDGMKTVPYNSIRPQKGTGTHKYVFLLFRQPFGKKITYQDLKFRNRWGSYDESNGVQDWASRYNLQPLAINFFKSENEGEF